MQSETQLLTELNEIAKVSPKTKEEMQHVEAKCIELMQQIKNSSFANTCPEEVWHFLSDADIRFKDPEYAKYQLPRYLAALEQWPNSQPNPSIKRDTLKHAPYVKR